MVMMPESSIKMIVKSGVVHSNLILRGWRKGELWVIGVVPTTNPPMLKLERLE